MMLNQVALSTRTGLEATAEWFIDGLGFLPAGGTSFGGPEIATAQGIDVPTVELNMRWLVDRTDFMQLELFAYSTPETRARPDRWTPNHIGYSTVIVHVNDFDSTAAQLRALDSDFVTNPIGDPGDRRACVIDPMGNPIEILERDPLPNPYSIRPEVNVAIRGIRATVSDLDEAVEFFSTQLGFRPAENQLNTINHDPLWALADHITDAVRLTDGRSIIELVTYGDHNIDRSAGYRMSDEGFLNIALGTTILSDFIQTRDNVANAGLHRVHDELTIRHDLRVNYVTSNQGFSVELMYMGPAAQREFGFVPIPTSTVG